MVLSNFCNICKIPEYIDTQNKPLLTQGMQLSSIMSKVNFIEYFK